MFTTVGLDAASEKLDRILLYDVSLPGL